MKVSGRLIFGIIVVIIGILLLLGSLGVVDAGDYIRDYWPVIMILFGVYNIIDRDSSTFFGVILILIGGYILLEKLDFKLFDHISLGSLIFPTIIVVVGLRLIIPERRV
jgi:hypothetical protein